MCVCVFTVRRWWKLLVAVTQRKSSREGNLSRPCEEERHGGPHSAPVCFFSASFLSLRESVVVCVVGQHIGAMSAREMDSQPSKRMVASAPPTPSSTSTEAEESKNMTAPHEATEALCEVHSRCIGNLRKWTRWRGGVEAVAFT